MRRPVFILSGALAVAAAVFALGYFAMARVRVPAPTDATDDLAWLRDEFKPSDAEMARIRQLHEGYLPKCGEMCARIAAKNGELREVLAAATNFAPVIDQKLAEAAALRAECQGQMLRHFYEVSHAMPPEPGRRYLEQMKRATLGLHARQEQTMTGTNAPLHVQP